MMRFACTCASLIACGATPSLPPDDVTRLPDAAPAYASTFRFAIVGDTRPTTQDDVAGYPTDVITQIWADVQAATPHPDFAVTTGDYFYSSPSGGGTADAQLDLYLHARMQFTNAVFAAMGNHECTASTESNCGPTNADGVTDNFAAYLVRLVYPVGPTLPYFTYAFGAGTSTVKIVVIAANAWDDAQAAWFDAQLAQTTTYTFVVRHESSVSIHAPGVPPSETIMMAHPVTLRIEGHVHTYEHDPATHEVIVGNGGAPLSSGENYGYSIIDLLPSGAIQLTAYTYDTNEIRDQWRIAADGSPLP